VAGWGFQAWGCWGLTFHAEAGRQQRMCVGEDPKGEGRKHCTNILIRQASQPASVVQTHSKKYTVPWIRCDSDSVRMGWKFSALCLEQSPFESNNQ
jgi:hypothetical protein